MIQEIELWNFESWEHVLLAGLEDGLNLICGESNTGKTSIIRAVRLAAYNEFSPKSVRLGADNCMVRIRTHRGEVKVTRGKDNIWEITPRGGKTAVFEKIGREILPEAAEILGLTKIVLGDVELSANIMDQLEGHFMLAELNGKSASGSLRAQVIDEISGLSGIEGVIKEVSLDRHRLGRKIDELEKKSKQIREDMHDANSLAVEDELLVNVEHCLMEQKNCIEASAALTEIIEEHKKVSESAEGLQKELSKLPDPVRISASIKEASFFLDTVQKAEAVYMDWSEVKIRVKGIQDELDGLPDADLAKELTDKSEKGLQTAQDAWELYKEYERVRDRTEGLKGDLKGLQDIDAIAEALTHAKENFEAVKEIEKFSEEVVAALEKHDRIRADLQEAEIVLEAAIQERDELMSSFKTCPLTQRPVSPECLKTLPILEKT